MLMCEQMILAVFIIAFTFGAEPEFQMIPVLLGSSADRTFMLRDAAARLYLFHIALELIAPVHLFR
jgi:hypothetical protein